MRQLPSRRPHRDCEDSTHLPPPPPRFLSTRAPAHQTPPCCNPSTSTPISSLHLDLVFDPDLDLALAGLAPLSRCPHDRH